MLLRPTAWCQCPTARRALILIPIPIRISLTLISTSRTLLLAPAPVPPTRAVALSPLTDVLEAILDDLPLELLRRAAPTSTLLLPATTLEHLDYIPRAATTLATLTVVLTAPSQATTLLDLTTPAPILTPSLTPKHFNLPPSLTRSPTRALALPPPLPLDQKQAIRQIAPRLPLLTLPPRLFLPPALPHLTTLIPIPTTTSTNPTPTLRSPPLLLACPALQAPLPRPSSDLARTAQQ